MNRLKELRKEKKYTQSYVANMLGVGRSTYTKYEIGEIEMSADILGRLADIYGVSVDYILGRPDDVDISDIDFALSGEIKDLSEEEKKDILNYVRFKRSQRKP